MPAWVIVMQQMAVLLACENCKITGLASGVRSCSSPPAHSIQALPSNILVNRRLILLRRSTMKQQMDFTKLTLIGGTLIH